jgi:hypothetical protein
MFQAISSVQVDHYKTFVFNGYRVKRGGFIEDKLGSLMLHDLRTQGPKSHAKYGTWIIDDLSGNPMVGHLHGRGFLEDAVRDALLADVRSLPSCCPPALLCSGFEGPPPLGLPPQDCSAASLRIDSTAEVEKEDESLKSCHISC